eukprot:TRINITY_DN3929_c0_g1_i1.p1 TRINITY_DN3929_c0_g1~~TRINITY_DN3929_c0_g1_i1.p1  ORF type:complete len:292 (-),score=101.27 TRINITY_DN3929_c0_g1_i1:6-881(-)
MLKSNFLINVLYSLQFCSAALFLTFSWNSRRNFTENPRPKATIPLLYAFFVMLLPVMWFYERHYFAHFGGVKGKDMMLTGRVILIGISAVLNSAIALQMKIQSADISQETLKKNRRGYSSHVGTEWEWVPIIGNMAAFLSFILSVNLVIFNLKNSHGTILLLAPILLLVQRDTLILREISEKNRFFIPFVAAVAFLLFSAVSSLTFNLKVNTLFKLAMIVMTIPGNFTVGKYLWDRSRRSPMLYLAVIPINLFPAIFANSSIRILGILGIVGGILQYLVSSRIETKGKNIL